MPNAGASGNVSVVTVEAAQEIAPALVRLMGELGGVYDLWLTPDCLTKVRIELSPDLR